MQIYSKNNKNCFFSLISWPILIWFALSGRAKFGTLNFYTEFRDFAPLIIYCTLCKWNEIMSLPGHQIFIFDQFKSVPHKIYDICCCEMRMSATSLTFWFIILNCVMQARPPRAFPLLHNSSEGMFLCLPEELYMVSAFFVSHVHSVLQTEDLVILVVAWGCFGECFLQGQSGIGNQCSTYRLPTIGPTW